MLEITPTHDRLGEPLVTFSYDGGSDFTMSADEADDVARKIDKAVTEARCVSVFLTVMSGILSDDELTDQIITAARKELARRAGE